MFQALFWTLSIFCFILRPLEGGACSSEWQGRSLCSFLIMDISSLCRIPLLSRLRVYCSLCLKYSCPPHLPGSCFPCFLLRLDLQVSFFVRMYKFLSPSELAPCSFYLGWALQTTDHVQHSRPLATAANGKHRHGTLPWSACLPASLTLRYPNLQLVQIKLDKPSPSSFPSLSPIFICSYTDSRANR